MTRSESQPQARGVRLGLRENLPQFALLVIVNAFVGAMVGMERSILPAIAEHDFHLAAWSLQRNRPHGIGVRSVLVWQVQRHRVCG
jgi:hypothetical protein